MIHVQATQLDRKVASAAKRRRIFTDWVAFFSTTTTAITSLHFVSRVPQDLLDAIAGQPQLTRLRVKWVRIAMSLRAVNSAN